MTRTRTSEPYDDEVATDTPDRHRRRRRTRMSRRRRILIGIAVSVAVLLSGCAIAGFTLASHLQRNVGRIDGVFEGMDENERPKVAVGTGLNFLLVGSDTRSWQPTTGRGTGPDSYDGRSDVLMVAHLSEDRSNASIVSIPRDSWVDVPGHGKDKINAGYALGGPPLAVRTVEQLTGVRLNHFAAIDFNGFQAVVDALGGVDVAVASPTTGGGVYFHKGVNHLNGHEALAYVRQRHGLPEGDFDRERRQQNLIRAIMTKVGSSDARHNPVKLYKLIDAMSRSISVDSGLSNSDMNALALSLLGIQMSDIGFLVAPVLKVGMEGKLSVVYLNNTRCAELWDAVKSDTMPDYLTKHSTDKLAEVPR